MTLNVELKALELLSHLGLGGGEGMVKCVRVKHIWLNGSSSYSKNGLLYGITYIAVCSMHV